MFGYLIASVGNLTEAEFNRYRACYCGLCRSLRDRHGQLSRFTLNYDMTFLVLLLGSLYEPEESAGSDRCIAHPKEKRNWFRSEISDYAADMNVALSYLKLRDNWRDDDSLGSLAAAGMLKNSWEKIREEYPMQCAAMEQSIFELNALEDQHLEDPDAAAATFGHLMASVFQFRGDRWSDTLYAFGDSLGRFIYLMDACMDLDSDTMHNRYNPFRRYYGLDNRELFSGILKMFLGEALLAFDRLPLVQDVNILKNILCFGLWSKFEEKYGSIQGPRPEP